MAACLQKNNKISIFGIYVEMDFSAMLLGRGATTLLLVLHLVLITLTILALQPIDRSLQITSMSIATKVSLAVHGIRLVRRSPPPSTFDKAALAWVQSVTRFTEFFYIAGDVILLSVPAGSLLLVSQSILAIFHSASAANQMFAGKYGIQEFYKRLAGKQQQALVYMGFCDIGTLLQLILAWISSRSKLRLFFQLVVYFNLLRGRYNDPSNESAHHKICWGVISSWVSPLAAKVPVLDQVLGRLKVWFSTPST